MSFFLCKRCKIKNAIYLGTNAYVPFARVKSKYDYKIRDLYKKKIRRREIANILDISYRTVLRVLNKNK